MRRVLLAWLAAAVAAAVEGRPAPPPLGPEGWIALSWDRYSTIIAPVDAQTCRVATYAQEGGGLAVYYAAQVRRAEGTVAVDASSSVAFGAQAAVWSPDSFTIDLAAGTATCADRAGRTHDGIVVAPPAPRLRLAAQALAAGTTMLSIAEPPPGAAQVEPWTPDRLRAQCIALLSAPEDSLRLAAVTTLARDPGSVDVLLEHLRRNADGRDGRAVAAALRRVKLDAELARRVFALWRALDAPPGARGGARNEVRDELLASLSAWDPKRFALHQVQTIQARVARLQRRDDLDEQVIEEMQRLAARTQREHAYRFVPALADQLDAFFTSRRQLAHKALVAITGLDAPFNAAGSTEERSAVAERYRELYYTTLKAKIPPIDDGMLADPFAQP